MTHHGGNPYHDAKGLFTTGPSSAAKKQLSDKETAHLRSKFGKLVKGNFSGHEMRKLRDRFGSTIKGG